ncbi:MAG: carboxypeptidase-like regulatory domain-containing protein, partial [Gemmatimonadota bacterium]
MRMRESWVGVAALLGLAVLPASELESQVTRAVIGLVVAANDSTPLSGVHVSVVGQPVQTESDEQGRFVLANLPTTDVRVVFQRIGLESDTVSVGATQTSFTAYLTLIAVPLEPVRAEQAPIARQRFEMIAQPSTVTLDPIEIENVPMLAEPDPIRAVQLLPGTVAKDDFTVGLNVRGGDTDQNLIHLDGMPVFNPSHLGGMFSTFDNKALSQVDFLAGGYPARYGGRLSSVLDVRLRPGDVNKTTLNGMVSFLSAKLMLEGPIGNTGITYLVSARRTYADAVLALFDPTILPYYFGDALAKVTAPLPASGTLSLTGYWGRDVLDLPWVEEEPGREGIDLELDWGNRVGGINWYQPIGSMRLDTYLSTSHFSTGLGLEPDIERLDNWARVHSARSDLQISPGRTHDVKFGLAV